MQCIAYETYCVDIFHTNVVRVTSWLTLWHFTVALQFQQYAEQGEGKKKGPVRTDVVSRAVELWWCW